MQQAYNDPLRTKQTVVDVDTHDPEMVEVELSNGLRFPVAAPPSPIYAGTMTEEEAARLLGMKPKTLVEIRLAGRGPRSMRWGRRHRYRVRDLEDYAAGLMGDRRTVRRRKR